MLISETLTPGRRPYVPTMECAPSKRRPDQSRPSARTTIVLAAFAYIASFQWAYSTILTRVYAYEGFAYRKDAAIIAATWVLALIPSFWMPSRLSRPSQLVYWFLYLIVIVPVTVVTIHSYPGDGQAGVRIAVWIVGAFAVLGLTYAVPPTAIPRYRLQLHDWWNGILIISILSYGLIFLTFGFRLHLPPLSEVHLVRSEYKNVLRDSNIYVSYAVNWQAYILNPLLIILGLLSRRKLLTALGVIGQLAIYSFSGFRGVLFSTSVLVVLLIVCRSLSRFGTRMLFCLTGAVAAATAVYLWFGSSFLSDLIVERLTGLPGLLTGFYFAFFTNHPKMMLSHSILGGFFHNPYGSLPPIIIGEVYFPGRGTYANANFWADAFANFGFWGLFTFTGILGLVFWLYDSITFDTDLRLAALMLVMPATLLANGALLTCLFTHGLGFACLVMYYLPDQIQAPINHGRLRMQYVPARSTRGN